MDVMREIIAQAVLALRPDPVLTVSEWADSHRFLPSAASAEPGPWRTSRTPYLKQIMDCLSPQSEVEKVVFMKGAQIGGPLAIDTPIPTVSGWKAMGDIVPGEYVFSETGEQCLVTGVSPLFTDHECFRVVFSDGSEIVADAGHLWTVFDDPKARGGVRKTLTTKQMAANFKVRGRRNRYRIPVAGELDLPAASLPIDPYTLGVWLGDGNSASNQITTHEDDAEEMASYMEDGGHKTTIRRPEWVRGRCVNIIIDPKVRSLTHCVRGHDLEVAGKVYFKKNGKEAWRCAECNRQSAMQSAYGTQSDPVIKSEPGFYARLIALDLIKNKHIPVQYLRSSAEQRRRLLQGLMDTDGSVTKAGHCEASFASSRLASDVYELLVSLGHKPTLSERLDTLTGFTSTRVTHYRLSFKAYNCRPVFRLKRKLERQVSTEGRRSTETFNRRIVDIVPTNSVPVRCISVASESRLFLAGRAMVPTHNTEAGNNWIGYVIHHSPGPLLAVQPTVEMAKRWSKQRVSSLIDTTPVLRERVAEARSRDSGNTLQSKEFPGGILVITGANSAVGLRSMPVRYLFLDEVDAYDSDVDGEGDPIALASQRTLTFANKKIFLVSTPTVHGVSRIEREFEQSDQRRYFVPCPHCEGQQWLKFERLRWEKGQPETAQYVCEHCEQAFEERHKPRFLEAGEWRATAEPLHPGTAGFHISGLYSPLGWLSWAEVARQWESAQGNDAAIKAFKNTVLGETWQERGEAPDWKRLADRKEEHLLGTVPDDVMFLTAGVDVQRDRIEAHVWGWGKGLKSWLVDVLTFDGSTAQAEVWAQLTALLAKSWKREDGRRLQLSRLAIDTGDGMTTSVVYSWVRATSDRRVLAVKGMRGFDRNAPVNGPTYVDVSERGKKVKRGLQLWIVSVSVFKSETYRFLRLEKPTEDEIEDGVEYPDGFIHIPAGTTDEWLKQLTAEQLVTVENRRTKFKKLEWQQLRERNEALDCRVYARAAAWRMGIDRWTEADWHQFEDIVAREAQPQPPAPKQGTEPSPRPVRELSSGGFLDRRPTGSWLNR